MSSEIQEGFIRQRRNLILGSLILLFAQVSGLKITDVNIFGTAMELEHAYSVNYLLWIAVVYWLLRYHQYKNAIGEFGLKEIYQSYFLSKLQKAVVKLTNADMRGNFGPGVPKSAKVVNIFNSKLLSRDGVTVLRSDMHYGSIEDVKTALKVETEIPKFVLLKSRIRASIDTALHNHLVTEYYLPLLIFLLPVLYQIYTWL